MRIKCIITVSEEENYEDDEKRCNEGVEMSNFKIIEELRNSDNEEEEVHELRKITAEEEGYKIKDGIFRMCDCVDLFV